MLRQYGSFTFPGAIKLHSLIHSATQSNASAAETGKKGAVAAIDIHERLDSVLLLGGDEAENARTDAAIAKRENIMAEKRPLVSATMV